VPRESRARAVARPAVGSIQDWGALTGDEFFTALKAVCQDGVRADVLIEAVAETERRLAGGILQARELHHILLVAEQHGTWQPVRTRVFDSLAAGPDTAVTVVYLEAQRLSAAIEFEEGGGADGFTACATLTVGGRKVRGRPGSGASKKMARRLAALSLVAALAGLPDPLDQSAGPASARPPAGGQRLSSSELYHLLLVASPVARPADRKAAWEQLTRSPQLAGGVLSLYTQARNQAPVRYVAIGDGVVVAVLPEHHGIQDRTHVGAPGRAATTAAARALAAVALLSDLMPPLADEPPAGAADRGIVNEGGPVTELNERSQVGLITELAFRITAEGPAHQPSFSCSITCRHAGGEAAGTGQGRSKTEARAAAAAALLGELSADTESVPAAHVQTVAQYATSPVGIAERLLQAGCTVTYLGGRFHLGLPDGWPLPDELPQVAVPAGQLAAALATLSGQVAHPAVRCWQRLSRDTLTAIAERRCYPAVDANGRDRWGVVLPGGAPVDPDEREFTELIAEFLLRPPGAALIAGNTPYAGPPAPLDEAVVDWADRCAELADPHPAKSMTVRLRVSDSGVSAELRPTHLGDPELRLLRRAARSWPPLAGFGTGLREGPSQLADCDVSPLLGQAGRQLSDLGIHVEWPAELVRGLTPRAVLESGPSVSATSQVSLSWALWLGDNALSEAELAAVARAEHLVRLRGQWVVIDPETLNRARNRRLATVTGALAINALLTGQLQIGDDFYPCAATGRLAELTDRIRDPRTDRAGGEPPRIPGLHGELRGYQWRAVAWLDSITSLGFGAVLADDMGLGKTLTIIAFHLHRGTGPTLVVCPASLLTNWEREIAKYASGIAVRRHHGAARDLDDLGPDEIVLTSYGTLVRDVQQFRTASFGLVVADEAQNIKNPRTQQARALRSVTGGLRIAVTGTPVENSLTDLWAILDWTSPGLFGTAKAFQAVNATGDGNGLRRLVGPFLLRRRKTDPSIAAELPGKIVSDHLITLTPEQSALYTAVTHNTLEKIRTSTGIQRRGLVLRMLQALRQICNTPAHYLRQAPEDWDPDAEAARSGKLTVLEGLLGDIAAADEASLIFTGYVWMAQRLATHLAARGIRAEVVHGGVPLGVRQQVVDRFQAGQQDSLILSVRAAGVGLNLTRAGHVIHFDRPWNPAVEDQATDRAHRIGQHSTVHVHHLITENTVEDHISELLRHKRALAGQILTGAEIALTELTDAELQQLVSLGVTS
jgi:superfamily II DNA or RNA helicase